MSRGEKKHLKGAFRAVVPSVVAGQEQHGEGSCTKVELDPKSKLVKDTSGKKRRMGRACNRNAARKRGKSA